MMENIMNAVNTVMSACRESLDNTNDNYERVTILLSIIYTIARLAGAGRQLERDWRRWRCRASRRVPSEHQLSRVTRFRHLPRCCPKPKRCRWTFPL